MKKLYLLLLIALLAFKCEEQVNADNTQEEDEQLLQQMRTEILTLSESVDCTDATEWVFTPMGAKACGGPSEYVAYNENIDVSNFLSKVNSYTSAHELFNQKWGIFSDCALIPQPKEVNCVEGKAELVF